MYNVNSRVVLYFGSGDVRVYEMVLGNNEYESERVWDYEMRFPTQELMIYKVTVAHE